MLVLLRMLNFHYKTLPLVLPALTCSWTGPVSAMDCRQHPPRIFSQRYLLQLFQIFQDFPFPQVCLALSVICLFISEGLNHCSRKAHKRPTTMMEINKVLKSFENIAYTSFRFKVFKYIVCTSSRFKDA